jgi:hypothetical protein
MVGGGEDGVSAPVEIEVFFRVGQTGAIEAALDLSEDSGGIATQFLGQPRQRLETGPAEAGRFEAISGQGPQDVTGDDDFFTPARALIKMTFRDPALIVATAYGALFVPAETLNFNGGERSSFLSLVCFHQHSALG